MCCNIRNTKGDGERERFWNDLDRILDIACNVYRLYGMEGQN